MGELAKALQDQVKQVADDKVLVPRKVRDNLLEAVEEYGLLKAMEEAEDSPLLTKEEALQDFAEHIEIYELVQARKDQTRVHSLDDLLAEEGLSRDDLDGGAH